MSFFYFLFTFFLGSSVFAVELEELKSLALENSLSLKAEEMEERALRSESEVVGRLQNPQLMGQFGSVKSAGERGATIEMSITQAIPLSRKNSMRSEIAQLALKSQTIHVDYFKRWVSHQVTLSAWRARALHELHLHGAERTRRFSLIKRYLETTARVSTKQKVELSIISAQLTQMEKLQDTRRFDAQVALNDLEFWVGRKVHPEELTFAIPQSVYVPTEQELNIKDSLEFIDLKNRVEIAQADVKLAKNERVPDLFVGGGYRVEKIQPENRFSYAIVGVNVPLWDSGSKRLEAARAREMKGQSLLTQLERQLVIKQKNTLELVRLSAQQLKRFPVASIKTSERTVDEAERGFRQGLLDATTFLQAENQSHELVDQVYLAWLGYLESLSTFQLTLSQDLNWTAKL